jgi:hypothetical protein
MGMAYTWKLLPRQRVSLRSGSFSFLSPQPRECIIAAGTRPACKATAPAARFNTSHRRVGFLNTGLGRLQIRTDSTRVVVKMALMKDRTVDMTMTECMEDKAAAKNTVR